VDACNRTDSNAKYENLHESVPPFVFLPFQQSLQAGLKQCQVASDL